MRLELQAEPEDIARLGSFKPLAAVREGRARTQPVKRVWHDSATRSLLETGLTLTESRGTWSLERVLPGGETWLPGQPPPVEASGDSPRALRDALPESDDAPGASPWIPLAAFEGRRSISLHRVDGMLLTMSVERGVLRSVAAERQAARLLLEGEDTAVHATALQIAGAFAVRIPTASLAAEGIALATGRKPPPRHLGAPRLPDPDMPITDGLAHILGHLTDVILFHAPAACQPDGPEDAETRRIEAVHQMRVATRRALSAVSIFRHVLPPGALDPVHAALRVLGKALSHSRDWDVFVTQTAPMVRAQLPDDARLGKLIAAAERQRRDYRSALADYLLGADFRRLGIELAWFAAARSWQAAAVAGAGAAGSAPPADDTGPGGMGSGAGPHDARPHDAGPRDAGPHDAGAGDTRSDGAAADTVEADDQPPMSVGHFGPGVVRHRWKKMVRAGKGIEDLDIPALHALRLRAKRARYAAEMFSSLDEGKATQRTIRRIAELQDALGVLNDGAVAAHLMEELGGPGGRHGYAVGLVIGFTAARSARIRPDIERAFHKMRKRDG